MFLRCVAYCILFQCSTNAEHKNGLEGHLEPLFSHGRRLQIGFFDGFPSSEEFYQKHVYVSKPVLFRGGAMLFPAYSSWNEEYFLSFPESEESFVTVELEKKENRTLPAEDMSFAAFVRELRTSGKYMINPVPHFLR